MHFIVGTSSDFALMRTCVKRIPNILSVAGVVLNVVHDQCPVKHCEHSRESNTFSGSS